jgi:pimeloyl-ACP methyl ester carboxylesterase
MRALLALVVVLGAVSAHALTFRAVEPFTVEGAFDLIIVPEPWNGGFFVYAHGYTPDPKSVVPYPADITPANIGTKLGGGDAILQIPLNLGYAVGTTTYRSAGWAVADAIRDVENVRRHFVRRYGKPKFTYVWGHSEGGLVTQAVAEIASPRYDGALPFCAPGAGGRRNLNAAFDLRALYEAVCGTVPGAEFTCRVCSGGTARCLADGDCPAGETCGSAEAAPAPEDGLTRPCFDFLLARQSAPALLGNALGACFGSSTPTTDQAARLDLFLRATQVFPGFVATDLFFASYAIAEVLYQRTHGRHPWSNDGVDYVAPNLTPAERATLLAAIPRAHADAVAVNFMQRAYEPRGRTTAKVMTLHALDDGLVIVENEEKYREAFVASGRTDQLVQVYTATGGHCGFSAAEHTAAFLALTGWVEHGTKPTASAVQASCTTFAPLVGGPCEVMDATPAEWGTRVVERRQPGAPPRELVCASEAADCPAGTTCSSRHHCR